MAFVCHALANICMPQGCDGVQLVALSIGPLCRHNITHSDRQIGKVYLFYHFHVDMKWNDAVNYSKVTVKIFIMFQNIV